MRSLVVGCGLVVIPGLFAWATVSARLNLGPAASPPPPIEALVFEVLRRFELERLSPGAVAVVEDMAGLLAIPAFFSSSALAAVR